MKELLYILLLGALVKTMSAPTQKNDSELKGVYIQTISLVDLKSNVSQVYSTDSLFIFGTTILEQVKKTDDVEINGSFVRRQILTGYNLIDFKTDTYTAINDLKIKKAYKFTSTISKKIGLDIHFNYYQGEPFAQSNEKIQGKTFKKIVYISKNPKMNGCKVSAFFRPLKSTNEPSMMPSLESKFGGRVFRITFDDKNGSEQLVRVVEFSPLIQNSYFEFLKAVNKKL